jgi:hypothetical protein
LLAEISVRLGSAIIALLAFASFSNQRTLATPNAAHDKTVWNYDGGIVVITDGSLPNGACFRVAGRLTSPTFFDNLKRVDTTDSGTIFRRGTQTLTEFPDRLLLAFVVYDFPCSLRLNEPGPRTYLTREMMSSLALSIYWKHGVQLRPVTDVTRKYFSVDPRTPYLAARAQDLPERFEWSYEFEIPGTGVPLTDSLVIIMRTPDGHIAARCAARM